MKRHNLLGMILISGFAVFNLSVAQACEKGYTDEFYQMISILKDIDKKGDDKEFYNFSTGGCEKIKANADEVNVSSYMPRDETSLGLYSLDRSKGASKIESIKHVYEYNIDKHS